MESRPADRIDPQRLVALLTRQRDLYQQLRELSERQRSLISGNRPEMLLNILRDRQTLVNGLATLNEQLAPFRRGWDGMYAQLPEDTRDQASALLTQINELLRVILKTDQEDSALLAARKRAVASEMGALSSGRSANAAYADQAAAQRRRTSAEITG
ncbi:MAG: flagellar protein FlgN [Planctomycetes bacterium]|nr:flagellar protein FlgN [Planctomycetota bacterium]